MILTVRHVDGKEARKIAEAKTGGPVSIKTVHFVKNSPSERDWVFETSTQ